jgi:hypothetical protein
MFVPTGAFVGQSRFLYLGVFDRLQSVNISVQLGEAPGPIEHKILRHNHTIKSHFCFID